MAGRCIFLDLVIKIYFKIGDTPKEGVEGERWTGNLGLVEVNYYI